MKIKAFTNSKQNICGVFTIEGSWFSQMGFLHCILIVFGTNSSSGMAEKNKNGVAYRLQQSGICVVKPWTQSKYENIRN